jgi:predicted ATPase/DNA-binding CsgD family transcriptional regulator
LVARAKPGGLTGRWVPLTSFIGRKQEAAEVAALLREFRLVTVTGPGGVGKTRLAVEVARSSAGQFPDGTFFVGLEAVAGAVDGAVAGAAADPARVAGEVAMALGVGETRGQAVRKVLAQALAPQRLLLVLDSCEHVLDAVAALCGQLLNTADDLRILTTSRQRLGVAGEARYRLAPLGLPGSGTPAEINRSEAVALFAERARRTDPRFDLSREHASLAARVVTRLDGMPLAIELAAARVEALGMAGLADRIDDALRLLDSRDSLAATRHRSLAAVADWSYQLLSGPEQAVFRRLAAFPGPFTLAAAEAAAGPDAEAVVSRLVDCSLLTPPRAGSDGRMRYSMLGTLRDYGQGRLAEAGEERQTMAALAGCALSVATQAAAGLEISDPHREVDALRWLDSEEATLSAALGWTLENDSAAALRLGTALAPWWLQRGRMTEGYAQLASATEQAAPGSPVWVTAQLWLGHLAWYAGDYATSLPRYTSAWQAATGGSSPDESARALAGRAAVLMSLGHAAQGSSDARRALALARQSRDRAAETYALTVLSIIAHFSQDEREALAWIQQAQESATADVPGPVVRLCRTIASIVLAHAGDLDAARRACVDGIARCRAADDLIHLASLLIARSHLEGVAGNAAEMRSCLREAVEVASRAGDRVNLRNCLEQGGFLCAGSRRWDEAVTLWAAYAADVARSGVPGGSPVGERRRREWMRRIEALLAPARLREAQDRGARMTLTSAAELVVMLTAPEDAHPEEAKPPADGGGLTERERELVTLVAQGCTNAEIAARLSISVRTVGSHLDRIREKTGYRRRADLTRLALREGLV